MENNQAFVAKLGNIKPIEGADKIVVASVILGDVPITQVVVGVDTKENTPVVYFDANMALEDEFVLAIDKLSPDFGKEDFKSIATYLAKGNRVRVIKLRGIISNGLVIEVNKVAQIVQGSGLTFEEGASFTELAGMKICHKWLPPIRNSSQGNKEKKVNKKKISHIIPELFHFHVDTQQLLRNLHELQPDQIISLSRKIHGTSGICAYAQIRKDLSVIDRVLKFFKYTVQDREWKYLYASRTVVKNEETHDGFYGTDVWSKVGKELFEGKLHKGETIYFEIVGYLPGTQSMIQGGYDYGNKPGDCSIAVYRITQTNEDGVVFEHSWQSMKERCVELQVKPVQEYYYGKVRDLYSGIDYSKEDWRNTYVENLRRDYLEKDVWDNLGKKVPDEGIVLRIESKDIRVFKLKSERFFAHESAAREAEVVDIEAEEGV